jgi:hypothetical protein
MVYEFLRKQPKKIPAAHTAGILLSTAIPYQ